MNANGTACDLLKQDCVTGCYPAPGSTTLCAPTGFLQEGSVCQWANDCVGGHVCLVQTAGAMTGICRKLCDLSAPNCPSGRTCQPTASGAGTCG